MRNADRLRLTYIIKPLGVGGSEGMYKLLLHRVSHQEGFGISVAVTDQYKDQQDKQVIAELDELVFQLFLSDFSFTQST